MMMKRRWMLMTGKEVSWSGGGNQGELNCDAAVTTGTFRLDQDQDQDEDQDQDVDQDEDQD